ncbi:MAG: dihydrolipoyl dehydrogenase [Planctomycetota bacterium]|jgi:dihydrolipoamide dehydrogenase
MAEKFDVVVIGSGPGGYAAAIRCAQKGASTAIIEKGPFGGTCLNCGCIPSKALLASAHILLLTKGAGAMGVDITSSKPNWPKIQARKNAIVASFRKGLTGLVQSNKAKILQGRGVVTEPKKIRIETDSETTDVQAERIILATGSRPVQIPTVKFDGETIISSKEALEFQEIPRSMVIIGGGVIGCEMACIYAAMGTKITIIEALSRLIPMEDQWVGKLIEREFKKLGIDSLTSQKVSSVDVTDGQAKVSLENSQAIEVEKILVSVGRKAVVDKETVEALNLGMSGSEIMVNKKMETSAAGVYAIGDVVGTTYLAHGAFREAEVAAVNATGGGSEIADYSLVPRAVYTFPEIASVGKTEEACKSEGLDVTIGRAFFKANGRSVGHNETVGEIRVVRDKATNKIAGVTIVSTMATELIAAARAFLGTAEKITEISFPHPTVSEVLKESWEDAYGMSLHIPPKAIDY